MAEYAWAKNLPVEFLEGLGIVDGKSGGKPAIVIPYYDTDGEVLVRRYRRAKEPFFTQAKGTKVYPYGLWRLADARDAGYVILVEGESDTQTLWFHGIPALGIPGAGSFKSSWTEHLQGIEHVYVWQEPDDGGTQLVRSVGKTVPEARVISPPRGCKDVSQAHVRGDDIPSLVKQLITQAQPCAEIEREEKKTRARDLRHKASVSSTAMLLTR